MCNIQNCFYSQFKYKLINNRTILNEKIRAFECVNLLNTYIYLHYPEVLSSL